MIGLKRLALLTHGAPPRNVLEAALRAKWGGGGAGYEKTVGPLPIISISDAKAKPAKSLVVGMEPIQDLHGYDSPWPAGGGVNKFAIADAAGVPQSTGATYGLTITLDNTAETIRIQGTPTWSDTTTGVSFRCISTEKGSYYGDAPVTHDYSGMAYKIFPISLSSNVSAITNLGISRGMITVSLAKTGNAEIDVLFKIVIATAGATIGDWTPYSNECPITGRTGVTVNHSGADTSDPQTYPLVFHDSAGTVYAGTVDVVSGLLTVDRAMVDLTGTDGWYSFAVGTGSASAIMSLPSEAYLPSILSGYNGAISSIGLENPRYWASARPNETPDKGNWSFAIGGNFLRFYTTDIATVSDLASFKAAFPVAQICYTLANPITYQLTPQQIQLLKGSNTLWSDADDLTLTYIGTTPPNLLGGMLGKGLGGSWTPPADEPEEEEQVPEEEQADESDPEEVIPDGE